MKEFTGVYEHGRDSIRHPTYWRSRNNRCTPHFHSAIELVYVEKGEMDACVGGENLTVRKGELLIVPSYSVHIFSTPKTSDTIVLVIPLDFISGFKRIAGEKRFTRLLLPSSNEASQIFYALKIMLNSLKNIGGEAPPQYHESFITRGQIYTILGILLKTVPLCEISRESGNDPIRDILTYLDKNHNRRISLKTLSKALGYSECHISRIFNKQIRSSIPEYLNMLRARTAAGIMLKNVSCSMTDVAMEAGFESTRTFYRAFKSCFGLTPSCLRQLPESEIERLIFGSHNQKELS